MKKIICILLTILCLLTLVACKPKQPQPTPDPDPTPEKTYTIVWKNFDGTVLETDENVAEGATPEYNGAVPTKPATEQYTYSFAGWTPNVAKVTANATYTATFTETAVEVPEKTYTIVWKNFDGTVLETDENVAEGATPEYNGAVPAKPATEQYTYSFAGWTPNVAKVTANATYTATFTETAVEVPAKTYTIVWKNFDGTVLETDENVAEGATPEYNGTVPQRPATENTVFIFAGWTPDVVAATSDAIYTAKYTEQQVGGDTDEFAPVFVNGTTVRYGLYPQSRVSDAATIEKLNALTIENIMSLGWYVLDGEFYAKHTAKVYNNETYTFNDGTTIVEGTEYWFKCEPVEWTIIGNNNGTYKLLCNVLLDAHNFYTDFDDRNGISPNNWQQSSIRQWLYVLWQTMFSVCEDFVMPSTVDNSAISTGVETNAFACENTTDKVFLLSYAECMELDQNLLTCKTTDFARANGAWSNLRDADLAYNGSYWTRSPSDEFYYCAWNVNSGGVLSQYAVDGDSHCVRPCICITVE